MEATVPHALRHATLPVRFPFRISRVTIGCGLSRFDTFPYYLLKVRLFTAPYGRTTIEFEMGVPAAKTVPRLPVISEKYCQVYL